MGIFLAATAVITFFLVLDPLGFTLSDFDPNNIYTTMKNIFTSGILTTSIIAVVFLGIFGVALLVLLKKRE